MSYWLFNLLEALFWVGLGGLSLAIGCFGSARYKKLAFYAGAGFALFGFSDILEIWFGSFLEAGMRWLFVWKMLNVLAIISAVVWYLSFRLRK